MFKITRMHRLLGTTVLSGSLLAGVVTAPAATAQEGGFQLEEITVTARKRVESLQDAPVSVTAFTQSGLANKGITNVSNISAYTPNVDINHGKADGGSTNASIFIRGVGQNDFIFPTDPGVGIYMDGVYIARSIGGMMDLADIERVEVLRGPQGTLYGKNTIGGAINIISSRPDGEFGGKVKATIGQRDRLDIEADIKFPITDDKVSAKVAVASKNQDGYVKRTSDGLDLGDTNVDVIRAGLNVNASEDVTVYLNFDASRIRQNGAPGTLLETFDSPGSLYGLYNAIGAPLIAAMEGLPEGSIYDDRYVTGDPYLSSGTGPTQDKNDTWGLSSTIDWALSDTVALKSITAYREMDAVIQTDIDYSPFPVIHTDEEQDQKQFSQEIQLSGDASDGRLSWLLGGYYFNEQISDQNLTLLANGLYQSLEMMPGAFVPLVPGITCPAAPPAPCVGGAGNPLNSMLDLDVSPTTSLDTDNLAAFLHVSYDISEKLSVTVGGRYSYEKKTYFIDSIYPASGRVATPPTEDSQNWSKFTPKFGLDYHVNEDVLLYATYSKGFKSGGWNPRPLQPAEFKRYDQENLTAYEVGVKSRLLDNRMTLNVAGFLSNYKDLQLFSNSVNPENGSLLLTVDNAGDVDIWGFEAEMVARLSEGFDVNAGIGYMDNEYKSLAASTGYSIDNKLPNAAKWTLNAGAQYGFDLNNSGRLTLRGDIVHRSKTFNNPQNTPEIAQKAYTVLNGRLTWDSADEDWQLAVFVLNITDKEYFTSAESIPAFGIRNAVYGRPREWGLSLSRSF
ncbi:TonB-dependent receptor [Kordiimonas sediminis]|uniref:TonB-dependent receptor n=1 Tax=Kordiimonas sediminis TaxID=1735581 RepID=A0A919ALP1_9PROT|nr:TonB-dependent receptor [Kordiimonas sediminis]GHF13991.1 TonB-dependent receptor [Kordiimonas sediminis]